MEAGFDGIQILANYLYLISLLSKTADSFSRLMDAVVG
jgi:hypothetical protein